MGLVSRLGNLWRGFLSLWISGREGAPGDRLRERHQLDGREVLAAEEGHGGHHPPPRGHRRALQADRRELAQTEAELNAARGDQPGRSRGGADPEEEPARRRHRRAEGGARFRAEGRRLAPRRRSSACRARSGSSRPSGTRCWPRCSRRRRASRSRSSSTVSRSTPRSRRSTTCASTSRTTIAEANLGESCSESSLDARLATLRNQAGDVQAKQQLAELKAKRRRSRPVRARRRM